jgi:hypothetical protein
VPARSKRIPTRVGDVLILHTELTFTIYVIGRVTADGQQDFHGRDGDDLKQERSPVTALAAAHRLRTPGHRVFLLHLDTGEWSEIH